MNIGYDFRLGGVQNSGIGRYTTNLIMHLLERDQKNTYFVFFHPTTSSAEDVVLLSKYKNVKLVHSPYRHYSLAEQIGFLRLLNSYPLDVMHFTNFNVPVLYKKPYVVTIHDVVHHTLSGHKRTRKWKFLAYKYIIENAARRSRQVITVSHQSQREIANTFAIPESKIRVTYEAGSLRAPEPALVHNIKQKLALSKPYLLAVGTMERKKNLVDLVKGFDRFIQKYKIEMELVIAGKPDRHYPDIPRQIMQATIFPERILLTGLVSDAELSALYTSAHAYISASTHEGFGLPGVEAMQFGIPLAVSNTPVYNEIYDQAAVFFDPKNPDDIADTLFLLARDKDFYNVLKQYSKQRSHLFTWQKTAAETLQIYEESA